MNESALEISDKLKKFKSELDGLQEEISFNEYLDKVLSNPKLAALAHERLYNMINYFGISEEGEFKLFSKELFGLNDQIKAVVDYFKSSGERMDTRKRILLLHGPVSSAKSSLVDVLKKGMELYSRTDEGAMYGIKNCPMHEEPLHVIPEEMRKDIMEKHGLYIEGDLCPHCRYVLDHEYNGDFEKFKVERIIVSEQSRIAIGTFLPSDPKSQDISELVGSINFSKIGEYGSESNPLAYVFDGELNISNRGIMEFIEMLKADEKFLYVLLTLTQEQVIKAPRFPRIYCDVVVMAHTNEAEFNDFISDQRSEALQDRIIKIDIPYNLKLNEEVKIYKKLLGPTKVRKHLSPHTIEVASMLAILSRLTEDSSLKLDLIKKMRLYNDEHIDKFSESDVREMHSQNKREGMEGISPRFIVNRISNALIQDDIECLTPIRLLKILKDGLDRHAKFSEEDRERYVNLISMVNKEYERIAEEAVKKAIVYSLEESCNDLFDTYLSNIESYVNNTRLVDEFGNQIPVDENLMRMLEKRMNVQESGKDAFRRQILTKVGTYAVRGDKFTYKSDDPLRKAIDEIIYEQNKHQIKAITTVKKPNDELQKKINSTVQRLMDEQNYCKTCAHELLKFVGAIYSKSPAEEKEEDAS
ncbi:MAG: protein prkA [Thermoplasmata archaeon]|nr:MAG: protein prkA [Thermoplasmata archaeon]